MLGNSNAEYGVISKLLHWLSAIIIISLFALGYWMVELDYYSNWYQTAPHYHQSFGVVLFFMTVLRALHIYIQPIVLPVKGQLEIEYFLAKLTHILLYLLLFALFGSGYLISTADNRPIAVFSFFNLPSLGEFFPLQADTFGVIHQYLAYTLMLLAFIHMIAAFKHHFIDKDNTLRRMTFSNND